MVGLLRSRIHGHVNEKNRKEETTTEATICRRRGGTGEFEVASLLPDSPSAPLRDFLAWVHVFRDVSFEV